MPHDGWEEIERRWRASPDDAALLEQLLLALRQARQPIPMRCLERRRRAGFLFTAAPGIDVYALLPQGDVLKVGATGGARPLSVPPHREWWVRPRSPKRLPGTLEQLLAAGVGGLSLARLRLKGLGSLGTLPHLRWLSLEKARFFGDELRTLEILPQLTYLNLARTDLRPNDLMAIPALPHLTWLDLSHIPEVGKQLRWLRHLKSLGYLRVPGGTTARSLTSLASLPNLTHLDFSATHNVTDELLERLPALFTQLEYLHVGLTRLGPGGKLTRAGLEPFARLKRLRALDLSEHWVTDLGTLAGAVGLRSLRLPSRIDDLEPLVELTQLTELDLSRLHLEDEELGLLSKLPSLEWLDLGGPLDGSGLKHLAQLANLNGVSLVGCSQLGPPALAHLGALPKLRTLRIEYCTGLYGKALTELASSGLRQLTLRPGVEFPAETRGPLAAALPECRIDYLDDAPLPID